MTGPTILYGPSAQTRHYRLSNGDLLVDVEGKPRLFEMCRDGSGTFEFHHDQIDLGVDLGTVRDVRINREAGCYTRFTIGPVVWEVVVYHPATDLYRCIPQGG
jgi:hypothetical protein